MFAGLFCGFALQLHHIFRFSGTRYRFDMERTKDLHDFNAPSVEKAMRCSHL